MRAFIGSAFQGLAVGAPMARGPPISKLYRIFTFLGSNIARRGRRTGDVRSEEMIVGIAAMMFVWLFGWGADYFHW
ncbi:MAG TPA: hypothetical protein VEB39_05495, partial [Sphingomicrobium sp.]|nr:hypothetical protein [Sphingomicrobium sp.]